MHWSWKNCPTAWHRQFKGHKNEATIILEAVANYETWIWHAFFGMSRSCNEINVLQRSPLMTRLALCEGPDGCVAWKTKKILRMNTKLAKIIYEMEVTIN
jgi:hypothetical protein